MAAENKQADLFDPNAKNEMMDRNSRNADALGLDTMRNLTSLSILVVGMRGVGVETAKNLVLAGPGSVTLWDPEITKIADLGTNFYLREEHVGKVSRAQASFPQVKSLHPYCKTSVYEGPLDEATLGKFGVVIVTEILAKAEIARINDFCRSKGITFILAWNFGLASAIFADHGANHQCTDLDGNPTTEHVIEHVDVDQKEGTITVKITGDQHGWDEGQEVLFNKMEGQLAWLNGLKNVAIKRKMRKQPDLDAKGNPKKDAKGEVKYRSINELNTFIVDLSKASGVPANLGQYKRGGYVSNVKPGKLFNFRSFAASLADPHVNDAHKYFSMSKMDMVGTVYHPDQWKRERERGNHLFAAFSAVLEFYSTTGALPKLHDRKDALEVIRLSKEGIELKGATDDTLTYRLALTSRTEVPGYCAFLGGVAAQEVMKRWGKWTPLYQWMVLDELNLLKQQPNCDPDWGCVDDCQHKRAAPDCITINSRYDHQIALFGQGFQKHIGNQKWFVVGCGALGCEYLKGIALMGIGAGERGLITVTDMDTIELSNLSRQFLFREEHLGQFKAVAGTNVALGMNPDLNFRVLQEPVGPTTEHIFTDEFWNEQTGIWNALDNVEARKYTDKKCLFHGLPLLESGTEGTKTNSEIILPFQTSTYNDGKDMETGGIAQCTLRNFPSTIIHCIEWAKPLFTEVFNQAAQDYNTLLEDKDKFLELADNQGAQQLSFLQNVKKFHDTFQERTYAKCLEQAFLLMDAQFTKRIKDLTHLFPEDARKVDSKTKKDQGPFWSGHKRFPKAIALKFEDPEATAELAKIEAEIAAVDAQPDGPEKSAQLEALDARKQPIAEQVEMVKMQFQFLFGGANLFATVLGLPIQKEDEFLATLRAANLQHPAWAPPAEGSVDVEDDAEKKEKKDGEEDEKAGAEDDDVKIGELRQFFEGLTVAGIAPTKPQKFEKDDDTNFHVDWVTAASNLRAYNYQIDLATRHRVKMVAGNIIPALATTTALITGLIEIEFYKMAMGLQYQEPGVFRNAQVNLGLSSFEMSAPPLAIRKKDEVQVFVDANGIAEKKVVTKMYPRGDSFTSWNLIEVAEGDITIGEFLEHFPQRYYGVRVGSLLAGSQVLYPPVLTPTLQFEKQLANAKAENQKKVIQKMLDNAIASNASKLKNVLGQKVRERFLELGGEFPTPHRNYIILGGSFEVPDNEQEAKENVAIGVEDGLPTSYEAEVPVIKFIFKHPEAPPVPGRV